jgi:hypothetical protein
MKEVNSSSARLYNWNILVEEYAKIGVRIDQDTKGLILSGDNEMMHELFKEIYQVASSWGNSLKGSNSMIDIRVDDNNNKSINGVKSQAQLKLGNHQ